jgi:hypothetical protein
MRAPIDQGPTRAMLPWTAPGSHRAAKPRTRVAQAPLRHLVLVRREGWQSAADWESLARNVRDYDPRVEPFVVRNELPNSYFRRKAAALPTLVFSPGALLVFRPLRGKTYQGRPIAKLDQLRLLAAAGVPVPRTAILTPDLVLDPADWGEFVVVKPTDLTTSSHGRGIQLMRTHRLRYTAPHDYPADHPGRRGPMMVQQFIDTGRHVAMYRVLTLFGEALYAVHDSAAETRVALSAADDDIESAPIASQTVARENRLAVEDDVLALARAAHLAIPDVPLKGCDILRDAATGALFVLELNPGGNTWHFSSRHLAAGRAKNGPVFERARVQQFDAFRKAARILADRTMAEAE